MLDFTFEVPTKVIFGKTADDHIAEEIKRCGGTKVLIHYGGQSAIASGLLDKITRQLSESGLSYVTLGGVVPNPRLSKVREGIELARREQVDFILAVGGGSAIDSAKAIAFALADETVDIWDYFCGKAAPKASYPVGVVLTIAAAGSETSNSCVITNEDGWLKRGIGKSKDQKVGRPVFAVMNPERTYSLPPYQTASGAVDILMHTQERYFTNTQHVELTDRMAEGLMVTVIHNAILAMDQPYHYDARAELMWAGSLSHNGLTGTGREADFASHKIEHELGAMFDVTHGAGLAAVWGSWARYVMPHDPARFAQFAVRVMACKEKATLEQTALAGIEAMEAFYRRIGMPTNLRELGLGDVTDEQIQTMASKCTDNGSHTVGTFVPLDTAAVAAILHMAK